ncbi:hypothetical protein PG990_009048 [Apiospora arundinis]
MEGDRVPTMQRMKQIPTMPRAMRSPPSIETHELYKKLHLLQCISKYTAPREPVSQEQQQNLDKQELRRSFTDQIAYLCDGSKDGSTTTAVFLQDGKMRNHTLWFATNETVDPRIRHFLEWVIGEALKNITKKSRESIEKDLLDRSTAIASNRIEFYRKQMILFAGECLKQLIWSNGSAPSGQAKKLIRWIKDLKGIEWHNKLSTVCYEARGEGREQSLIAAQKGSAEDCFAELAHYIGRLGAHLFAVKTIVHAALMLPTIKSIAEVQYEECPDSQVLQVDLGLGGPYEMLRSIVDSQNCHSFEKLQILQNFAKIDLEQDITGRFRPKGKTTLAIKTFVHAELQLYDLASRRDLPFVEDDRYVGCSKPACYFCQRYSKSHPKDFVEPPSHHKVLLGVRAPAANPNLDVRGKGAAILCMAQSNMEWKVEQDILQALSPMNNSISFQHCSTDGFNRAPMTVTTQFDQ